MTSREFRERLTRRAVKSGASIPDEEGLAKLQAYFTLLARWNAKINLTALPLDKPTDETFDRLFIEPLAAARHFPAGAASWFDLGSGGGSPAIPLRIAVGGVRLTMVESKVRKAAFLREAVRMLGLAEAFVENARFEDVADRASGSAQVVTVRAVRPDAALFNVAAEILSPGGRILLFRQDPRGIAAPSFSHLETVRLIEGRNSYLGIYSRMFHVKHPD